MPFIVASLCLLFADCVETTRALTRDETVAVFGRLVVPAECRLDLKGHTLRYTYLTQLEGTGEITDSSTGEPGRLELQIENDCTETFTLSGNLQLVKSGEGTLKAADKQFYTGGTVIEDGVLTVASTKYSLGNQDFRPFGSSPSVITIAERGKLYPHGLTGWKNVYDIILAGGEIVNTLKTDQLKKFDAKVTLTEDSRLSAIKNEKGDPSPAGFAGDFDLNGHTLLLKIESPVYLTGTFSNGTLITYGTCTNHVPQALDLKTVAFKSHTAIEGEENILLSRPFCVIIK